METSIGSGCAHGMPVLTKDSRWGAAPLPRQAWGGGTKLNRTFFFTGVRLGFYGQKGDPRVERQNKDYKRKKRKNYVISSRSKSTTTREYFLLGPRRPKDSGGGAASGGPPSVLPPRFRPKRTGSSGSAVGAGAVSWSSVRRTAIAILRRCLHRANAAAARLADMIAFWIAEKPPVDGAFVSRLLGEALAGG